VKEFLQQRINYASEQGVSDQQILVDPGPDLNKNTYHSLELMRKLPAITEMGYPTLVAASNKDFLSETLGLERQFSVDATIAANTIGVLNGARVVRVHDVKAAVGAMRTVEAILGWRNPEASRHNLV
jgi:dihydropteroate synthase